MIIKVFRKTWILWWSRDTIWHIGILKEPDSTWKHYCLGYLTLSKKL